MDPNKLKTKYSLLKICSLFVYCGVMVISIAFILWRIWQIYGDLPHPSDLDSANDSIEVCVNGACKCPNWTHYDQTLDTCRIFVGYDCEKDDSLCVQNAHCGVIGQCVCNNGYKNKNHGQMDGFCEKEISKSVQNLNPPFNELRFEGRECIGEIYFIDGSGTINYRSYINGARCILGIYSLDPNVHIEIEFIEPLNLEGRFDRILALDQNAGDTLLKLSDLDLKGNKYKLETNRVLLIFKSYNTASGKGFQLKYKTIKVPDTNAEENDCCLVGGNGTCRDGGFPIDGHCGVGVCGAPGGCGGCWGGCRIKSRGVWSANLFKSPKFRDEMGLVWGKTHQECVDFLSFTAFTTNSFSSIDSLGNCVNIYAGPSCTGEFKIIKPGGNFHHDLALVDFDNVAKSISSCQYLDTDSEYYKSGYYRQPGITAKTINSTRSKQKTRKVTNLRLIQQ